MHDQVVAALERMNSLKELVSNMTGYCVFVLSEKYFIKANKLILLQKKAQFPNGIFQKLSVWKSNWDWLKGLTLICMQF